MGGDSASVTSKPMPVLKYQAFQSYFLMSNPAKEIRFAAVDDSTS
jgi:hypothetical protein